MINSIVNKITAQALVIDEIADQLENYIDTVQNTLGDNIFSLAAETAFQALGRYGVTKANLAVSGDLVNSRTFLDYDQIKKDPNLQGKNLTFEKQEDGTYKVLKNGGRTGYYTTGLAAAFYMKTLTNAINKEIEQLSTSTPVIKEKQNNLKQSKPSKENAKKAQSNYIEDETTKNSNNYTISSSAEDVININDIAYMVDHKKDVVIPKGKHLYLNGEKKIGTDATFRYNTDTNKYHLIMSDGNFSTTSYSLYEMSKAGIK